MSQTQQERYTGIFEDDSMSPSEVVGALQAARTLYLARFMDFASGKRAVRASELPPDIQESVAAYDDISAHAAEWFNRHRRGKVHVAGEFEEVIRILLDGDGMTERRCAAPSRAEGNASRDIYEGLAYIAGAALRQEGFISVCQIEIDPILPEGLDMGRRLVMPASGVWAMQWSQ